MDTVGDEIVERMELEAEMRQLQAEVEAGAGEEKRKRLKEIVEKLNLKMWIAD